MNFKVVLKNKESESLELLKMVRRLSPHACELCDSELGSLTSVAVLEHIPESLVYPAD